MSVVDLEFDTASQTSENVSEEKQEEEEEKIHVKRQWTPMRFARQNSMVLQMGPDAPKEEPKGKRSYP